MKSSTLKISIITPVYNQVDYIENTIVSVLNQGYENLEYIIIDGGSTDGTVEVIKKYEHEIFKFISEKDKGMYDALNKGFSYSSGEIMAWINSDDVLAPKALTTMNQLFNDLPNVNWIQGLHGFIDLESNFIRYIKANAFSLIRFLNHDYKFIQQESTFWRRDLWTEAGGYIDNQLKLAGDFELWFRFFQYSKLYNVDVAIGGWRKREGQLSDVHIDNYEKEVENIINSYKLSTLQKRKIKKINNYKLIHSIFRKSKILNSPYIDRKISKLSDLNKTQIIYSYVQNKFIIR